MKKKTRLGIVLERRKISQTAFARTLGNSITSINNHCVRGIRTVRVAKRYAEVLHCRPEELLEF